MSYMDMGSGETAMATQKLLTPRGLVAAFGFGVSLLGLVLQWSQGLDDWGTTGGSDIKTVNMLGMYTLFMLGVGALNLVSFIKGRPELLWAGLVVYVVTMDANVCAANSLSRDNKDWLVAAYGLAISGTALTFAVVDFRLKLTKYFWGPLALSLLLVLGSILIWAGGNACGNDGNSNNVWRDGPVPPARGVLLAVIYTFSALTSYTAGLELVFMFAALGAYAFRPFGWRCTDHVCQAGVTLSFLTLLMIVAFHLVASCKPTKSFPMAVSTFSKATFQFLCIIGTLIGAVLLWSDHYDASYSWAAVTMVLVTMLMLAVELVGHWGAAVAGLCFLESVIDVEARLINESNEKTQHRVGYIMMLFFTFMSLLALPCDWSDSVALNRVDQSLRPFFFSGAVAFASVVYLWSEAEFYGGLGLVAMVIMFCAVKKFDLGFQWAYFLALNWVVTLTPFTTDESGANKVAVIIIGFAFVFFIHLHIERFGAVAFDSLRLFTNVEGSGDGGFGFMDTSSRPFVSNPGAKHAEPERQQPQQQQQEYGTVAPASAVAVAE